MQVLIAARFASCMNTLLCEVLDTPGIVLELLRMEVL